MNDKILAVGLDPMLLRSRAMILARRHYECGCSLPEAALERLRTDQFSILLVCCSLPFEAASQLIRAARDEFADLGIVRLVSPGSPTVREPIANVIVGVDFTPLTWVNAVEGLAQQRNRPQN